MKNVQEALEALPKSGGPARIARKLEREGIRGMRRAAWNCPLSVYLKRETGEPKIGTTYYLAETGEWPFGEMYDLPPNVTEFVRRFDQGRYPYLELGESE